MKYVYEGELTDDFNDELYIREPGDRRRKPLNIAIRKEFGVASLENGDESLGRFRITVEQLEKPS